MTSNVGARGRLEPPALLVGLTIGLVCSGASWLAVVGSDALWLAAMGDSIREARSIPDGIPFATAQSSGWPNTTALGQVAFSLLFKMGSAGLVAAQVAGVALVLGGLALESTTRRGRPWSTSLALLAVALGAAAPLLIARAQLLSLVPYGALLYLLRRQHDSPSRAIWWAVPLISIWSNLHGAVLVGVAVLGCYLALHRLRHSPVTAVAVGLSSMVAACVNPATWRAPTYYVGVFSGEATNDESGMWSRLTLANPLDVLLVAAAIILLGMAFRRRRPLWEYGAALGLGLASIAAARHGVWLVLFLAVPAATSWLEPSSAPMRERPGDQKAAKVSLLAVSVLAAGVLLAVRTPSFRAADAEASSVANATQGEVVLAKEPLAEALAAAGARVWASNPLDAFASSDQAAFLGFIRGDPRSANKALAAADAVVALPGSAQALMATMNGFTDTQRVGQYLVMRRD